MKNLLNMDYNEMKEEITKVLGCERYRADQIADWIYDKKVLNFDGMTNLSKVHRRVLKENYSLEIPRLIEKRVSRRDGTVKFLWELEDGNMIESVLIFHPNRITACLSTQVGCPLKCRFCATGMGGFVRNLKVHEIVGQVLGMEVENKVRITNVVYMGMGEPLLNYENLMKSMRILIDKKLKGMSPRRITISTAGIVPKIYDLIGEDLDFVLSVSIHASDNEKRSYLMPINDRYPLEELVQAMKDYTTRTGRRVTVEYVLIENLNDRRIDAERLARLLSGMKVNVNLIPYNPNEFSNFRKPDELKVKKFAEILRNRGIEAVVRVEKGSDIEAACGQLRLRRLKGKERSRI